MPSFTPFYETLKTAIENTWPMITLFIIIISIIRISYIIINHESIVFYKEFYNLVFIVYILLLYNLLLSTEGAVTGINLIPFKEITRYNFLSRGFIYNVIGNIALFMPFGYFISSFLKEAKIHHILLISAIISLTAEIIQYNIGRAFDVDDIILNVLGSLIGFIIYEIIMLIKTKLPKALQNNIFYNILATIVIIIIILVFIRMWGLI